MITKNIYFKDFPREGQTSELKLKAHAELTKKLLERFLKNRGWTRGKCKWELELLQSANNALGIEDVELNTLINE